MDTRYSHKKGRDKFQKEKYVHLHHQIALILQNHTGGLYRNDILIAIDNERVRENVEGKLTLVTLRKHLIDFIENEKLVIETDINPYDESKMPRRKLFWAFQHMQVRIINDLMKHWLKGLEKQYNDYVIEKKSTNVKFSDAISCLMEQIALVFVPVNYNRLDGKKAFSYFLASVPIGDMDNNANLHWEKIKEKSKLAIEYMQSHPNRKHAGSFRVGDGEPDS